MSRKTRKAASQSATSQNEPNAPYTLTEIPLAQPDRSGPSEPTLYDLAAEREAELRKQIPALEAKRRKAKAVATSKTAGNALDTSGPATGAEGSEDAFITSLIYGLTLTTVHITLDILTWHQYAQTPSYIPLITRNLKTTLPLSVLLVFIFHAPVFGLARFDWLRRALFFSAAVVCGVYAVYLSSEGPFLAVMKRVPPVVTMVVWCVMEMGPGEGCVGLGVVGGVVWWMGWKVF